MTIRSRSGRTLLASTLALTIPLSGCFGTSEDKGDNGGANTGPKPGVQDANTAGSSKEALPPPPANADAKPGTPTATAPN